MRGFVYQLGVILLTTYFSRQVASVICLIFLFSMRILDLFLIVLIVVLCVVVFVRMPSESTPPQLPVHETSPVIPPQAIRYHTPGDPASFYHTIVESNLFRPLGWRKQVPRPQYELLGTITGRKQKAFILDKRTHTLHTITTGEPLDKATLIAVDPKHVTLRENNQTKTLRLTKTFLR